MCGQADPQRPACREQPQKQPEKADGEHGEVPGAGLMTGPMVSRVLVRATHRTGYGLVLRCVLRVAGALRSVADQVQSPEDPVAEEQRADEQHGQLPGAEQLHRRSGPVLLVTGDAILPISIDLASVAPSY
jgi:hypothetical protein